MDNPLAMKKVLAKANFTAESSEKATTPVINDTTDTTDEPQMCIRDRGYRNRHQTHRAFQVFLLLPDRCKEADYLVYR